MQLSLNSVSRLIQKVDANVIAENKKGGLP